MNIRKISIGPDYLKSMNYQIGQPAKGSSFISNIINNTETGFIEIWISNKHNEKKLWKSFTTSMPMSIEHNIDSFLEEKQ